MKAIAVSSLALGLVALACTRPGGPSLTSEFGDASVGFVGGNCLPVTTREPLPARSEVTMPDNYAVGGNVVTTDDLFTQFNSFCGPCHVQQSSGGFGINRGAFTQLLTMAPDVIDRMTSDDPGTAAAPYYMPPDSFGGKAYSRRGADDPLRRLVGLLQSWLAQGSPAGSFSVEPAAVDGGAALPDGGSPDGSGGPPDAGASPGTASQADYSLTPAEGEKLTNIGTCIPNKYTVGVNAQTMDRLDAFFADATELPTTLDETDLTTLDSDTLARNGVISYVPAYPLWSDDAGKMRHVRTPRGQPIAFDKQSQSFKIPPNTRFYKTFFKDVVDGSGSRSWKRMETRLIVSRPDRTLTDGTVKQTALYGTYVWDQTETHAVLLTDPLHDGKPFADRLVTYVADEPRERMIRASFPGAKDGDYRLEKALEAPGVRRHYAIPGSERCIQCHMGSPSAAFVLGFTALQVATVPPGTSGVIEPATSDELTQLQRLIDYGVIAGMASPADVTPLENTQLPRTPRNAYELSAQAYMVGNCAHCHNPRGFPSTKAPELKEVLDFLPSPDGGIFQFPLDRTSPVRSRGLRQDVPIPYITPSLRDLPGGDLRYKPKYKTCDPTIPDTDGWCPDPKQVIDFIQAPWRSLIYRNVDTPFDYVDDFTIFPHMPLNTPGYDCRAAHILGDWMVSIPAVRVNTKASEDDVSTGDSTPQPYAEIPPGDPGYAAAQTAAGKRLAAYHAGHRYDFCPDSSDIVDLTVLDGNPLAGDPLTPTDLPIVDDSFSPARLVMPQEGVPDRPHWVATDATDPPGDWLPRGFGWEAALVDHNAENPTVSGDTLASLQDVLSQLTADVRLDTPIGDTTVRAILTTEVPFGLWKQKPGCDFTSVPTAGSFQEDARPLWMDSGGAISPDAPVYVQSLGAAVFTNICINCHGANADANGLLADEISIMTGGDARVANFRTGLFGPPDTPGMNRQRTFIPNATDPHAPLPGTGSPDDYGARYMAWMALGGTEKILPPALLTVVAATPVLGRSRNSFDARGTANMLQLAKQLCSDVLLSNDNHYHATLEALFLNRTLDWTDQTSLIGENGDAYLWLRLCSLDNRPVVRVVTPAGGRWTKLTDGAPTLAVTPRDLLISSFPGQGAPASLYWGDGRDDQGNASYPDGAAVLDHHGRVQQGLTPDNLFPICVRPPANATERTFADMFLQAHPIGTGGPTIPYCPDALFAKAADGTERWALLNPVDSDSGQHRYTDANHWANRGAINAGLAVFLYIDQLSKGKVPQPLYNQCEQLRPAAQR